VLRHRHSAVCIIRDTGVLTRHDKVTQLFFCVQNEHVNGCTCICVQVAPHVNELCVPDSVLTVNATELFQLKCDVTGSPVPVIRWTFNVRSGFFFIFYSDVFTTRVKSLKLSVTDGEKICVKEVIKYVHFFLTHSLVRGLYNVSKAQWKCTTLTKTSFKTVSRSHICCA